MASVQNPIFRLLRIYDFATAHLPIIYELQIDKIISRLEIVYIIDYCA